MGACEIFYNKTIVEPFKKFTQNEMDILPCIKINKQKKKEREWSGLRQRERNENKIKKKLSNGGP